MLRFWLIALMTLMISSSSCLADAAPSSAQHAKPSKKTAQRALPAHEHRTECETTAAEPVQIICILDRSGSMQNLAEDTIGGYNAFLEKQRKEPGEAEVTTVLFDDKYEKITDAVALKDAPELTSKEYYARGTTALLDAVGRTVTGALGQMEQKGVCPAKRRVIVLIMTDGLENASTEYDKASVKALIEGTTNDYHWNYIFMGANMDSVAEASSIGIQPRHAANYSANRSGIEGSFALMDAAAREVREKGSVSEDWKDGQT